MNAVYFIGMSLFAFSLLAESTSPLPRYNIVLMCYYGDSPYVSKSYFALSGENKKSVIISAGFDEKSNTYIIADKAFDDFYDDCKSETESKKFKYFVELKGVSERAYNLSMGALGGHYAVKSNKFIGAEKVFDLFPASKHMSIDLKLPVGGKQTSEFVLESQRIKALASNPSIKQLMNEQVIKDFNRMDIKILASGKELYRFVPGKEWKEGDKNIDQNLAKNTENYVSIPLNIIANRAKKAVNISEDLLKKHIALAFFTQTQIFDFSAFEFITKYFYGNKYDLIFTFADRNIARKLTLSDDKILTMEASVSYIVAPVLGSNSVPVGKLDVVRKITANLSSGEISKDEITITRLPL